MTRVTLMLLFSFCLYKEEKNKTTIVYTCAKFEVFPSSKNLFRIKKKPSYTFDFRRVYHTVVPVYFVEYINLLMFEVFDE
jgi:hypothetical protein